MPYRHCTAPCDCQILAGERECNAFHGAGLANEAREPSATPISGHAFSFESRKLDIKDVRRLIYEEVLEFHPLDKDRYHDVRAAEARAAEFHRQQQAGMPLPAYDYNHMVR